MKRLASLLFICSLISACAPEVGSEAWCKEMKEKPKGDWSTNEAKDYTKYCIFKFNEKE